MDLFLDDTFPYGSVLLDWQCHDWKRHGSHGGAKGGIYELLSDETGTDRRLDVAV